ncbi:MAG: NAD-dependent epimerase/dehydratase family protein [Deltaproteobacteria bacterium]|nr:MAG: NAD-dependent epimerase/dehydratase family protein [Deltaproteobacteria bacterium]
MTPCPPDTAPSRVLVTGGAGFIGAHLCRALDAAGHTVVALDDLSTGRRERLHDLPRTRLVVGDVRDRDTIAHAAARCDAVVHLAAIVSVPLCDAQPDIADAVNRGGTARVLQVAEAAGIRRVVFASSAAVYGSADVIPQHEDLAVAPLSDYGAHKADGERLCAAATRRGSLAAFPLRFFNVYGPGQSDDGPYAAVLTAWNDAIRAGRPLRVDGDGRQTRDFVHVDDVVHAIRLALGAARRHAGHPLNVGSGNATAIGDLAAQLCAWAGHGAGTVPGPPRRGDVRHSVACLARVRRALAYTPRVSLPEGLRPLLSLPPE